MPSFLDLVNKAKEEKVKKEPQSQLGKRGILYGTGLTKRVVERTEKELERRANENQVDEQIGKAFQQTVNEEISSIRVLIDESQLEFDASQDAALKGLVSNRFACMIGAAGTGKTTVTKRLIKMIEGQVGLIDLNETIYVQVKQPDGTLKRMKASDVEDAEEQLNIAIACVAFTGRAVQQIKRALPREYHPMCKTIHAALAFMPVYEEMGIDEVTGEMRRRMTFKPTFTKWNKMPYKVYIIDESSMVPIPLWNQFIDAMPDDARIYMIGDINQLPPVKGRSTFGFAMMKWPTFELTKIHRQAEGNPIIKNAHAILNGRFPQKFPQQFDILDDKAGVPPGSIGASRFLLNFIKKLHQAGQFDPIKDALIVPQNKSELGQVYLNEHLVHYFNPPKEENGLVVNKRIQIHTGTTHVFYALGDKVMLLENDNEKQLTNGMIGIVSGIEINGMYDGRRAQIDESLDANITVDVENFSLENFDMEIDTDTEKQKKKEKEDQNQRQSSHILTISFADRDEEVKFSTAGGFKKVTHAYAFTCHKSQGGEYPTVVILCHSANGRLLCREWLYTAVTRAVNRVILVCNDRGLAKAINNQKITGKTLEEKIKSFQAWANENDDLEHEEDLFQKVPNLPQPEQIEEI